MNNTNNITNSETPKYLKHKESNISKAKKKSKHKHQYEECLIQYRWNFKSNVFTHEQKDKIHTSLKSYCIICGKIGNRFKEDKSIVKDYRRTVDTPTRRWYQVMTSEELYEKYHDKMPVFLVKDIFKEKHVDLEQNCNPKGE